MAHFCYLLILSTVLIAQTSLATPIVNEADFDSHMQIRRVERPSLDTFNCNLAYSPRPQNEIGSFFVSLFNWDGLDKHLIDKDNLPKVFRAIELYLFLKKDPNIDFVISKDVFTYNYIAIQKKDLQYVLRDEEVLELLNLRTEIDKFIIWNNTFYRFETTFRDLNLYASQDDQCNISVAEIKAFKVYTNSMYTAINQYLYGSNQAPNKALDTIVEYLSEALEKLKPYEGHTIRQANLPNDVWQDHKPNAIVNYKGFTSTSIGQIKNFTANMIIRAHNKGRFIAPLSHLQDEREVLFPPNTRFKILYNSCFDNPEQKFIPRANRDCKVLMEEVLQ